MGRKNINLTSLILPLSVYPILSVFCFLFRDLNMSVNIEKVKTLIISSSKSLSNSKNQSRHSSKVVTPLGSYVKWYSFFFIVQYAAILDQETAVGLRENNSIKVHHKELKKKKAFCCCKDKSSEKHDFSHQRSIRVTSCGLACYYFSCPLQKYWKIISDIPTINSISWRASQHPWNWTIKFYFPHNEMSPLVFYNILVTASFVMLKKDKKDSGFQQMKLFLACYHLVITRDFISPPTCLK